MATSVEGDSASDAKLSKNKRMAAYKGKLWASNPSCKTLHGKKLLSLGIGSGLDMKGRPFWEFLVAGPEGTVYASHVVKICIGFEQNYPFKSPELFLPDVPKDSVFHLACGFQEFSKGGKTSSLCTFCEDIIKTGLGGEWGPVKKAEQFAFAVYEAMKEDGKEHNVHGEKVAKLSDGDRNKLIKKTLKKMKKYT